MLRHFKGPDRPWAGGSTKKANTTKNSKTKKSMSFSVCDRLFWDCEFRLCLLISLNSTSLKVTCVHMVVVWFYHTFARIVQQCFNDGRHSLCSRLAHWYSWESWFILGSDPLYFCLGVAGRNFGPLGASDRITSSWLWFRDFWPVRACVCVCGELPHVRKTRLRLLFQSGALFFVCRFV
jgi:hypothetical protein